jgi:hypothetical protein
VRSRAKKNSLETNNAGGGESFRPRFFRDANTGDGQGFTDLTVAVQLRLRVRVWVANFDSEAPALNRMEHGANPWQPTNFEGRSQDEE